MANSQPYPQAGPSSIPYHHPSSSYSAPESSYHSLTHYAPNQSPQGSMSHHSHGSHHNSSLYSEFIPQQRHFRKGHRPRRFPQHIQQQTPLHYYQSQPMFPPPHPAVMDPYHLPPDYFLPPHDLWTPQFSPPPPPQHLAYAYQAPYPPPALPKQLLMPPYGKSPSPHITHAPLTPLTSEPDVHPTGPDPPSVQPQGQTVVVNAKELLIENLPATFPIRKNIHTGLALQLQRPLVQRALAVTISYTARPPASFLTLLDADRLPSVVNEIVFHASIIDLVNVDDKTTSPKQESILPEPSLTSIMTPETSTGAETPQLASPRSSVTSASILAQTIPDISEDRFGSQPESSPPHQVVESEPVTQLPLSPLPVSHPSPPLSQTAKKSWASLLRPQENDRASVNGLPTSAIQGFSIPATHPLEFIPKSARTSNLLNALTSPNAFSAPLPNLRARGLINLGNMCFANTVLQILMYSPPFYSLFSELDKYQNTKESPSTPLINATFELMQEFRPIGSELVIHETTDKETTRDEPFIPTVVYQALKEKKRFDSMRGGQQEDAEEFLGFYLDTLEDEFSLLLGNQTSKNVTTDIPNGDNGDGWQEIGRKNKAIVTRTHKATESPISRIFNGKFRTTLKVPGSRDSAMIDPWSRLQLDIQSDRVDTIEDALRYMTEQRTVQMSSATKGQVDANQQTLIETLPPILILHLKRFLYDTSVNDVVKLSKKITFSPEFIIPKGVLTTSRRFQTHRYKLFGVLNHHGTSATGGHYTLDVLHPDPQGIGQEGWVRLDDDCVQDITVDDLLSKDFGDDKAAYLLFYRRI